MKIFDIQNRDLTYCFKVWDNELQFWKDLARVKSWKFSIEPRSRWDVLRTVQISASDKSKFDALTAQILDIPGIEFEGEKPPSRPSSIASSQKHAAKRNVTRKSNTSAAAFDSRNAKNDAIVSLIRDWMVDRLGGIEEAEKAIGVLK